MLVKDLISTFRPNEGDGTITYIFSSKEDTLCSSENYDFVSEIFGDREVISWRVESRRNPWVKPKVDYLNCDDTATVTKSLMSGVMDYDLCITCEQPQKCSLKEVSSEEYKKQNQARTEEFEKKNQEFLESLNEMPEPSKYDNHDIRNLKLPARVMNRLTEFGIESVGDLRNFSRKDLLEVKGLAKRGVDIIEHRLYQLGLGLKKGE